LSRYSSECIGRSGAKNDRAREAGSINQSLLTLGRVITALVDHHPHVPYRDSKLTRLLQESLGGKAKTCIIATLSPSNSAVEETMSTLDYAYRAKNIKNQPTVNQKLTKKVIMKEYFAEIETLRNQLMMTREKNGVYVDPQEFYAMESKIASQEALLMECEAALKQRNEEFKLVKSENDDLTNRLQDTMDELTEKHEELLKVQDQYEIVKDELSTTYVELKATEAVVGEQVVTEKELSRLGHSLERNITEKSHEIEILLKKIQTMESSDQQKMLCSTSFTSKLMKSTNQLLSSLQMLSTQNVSSSNILNNGIATMLTKGKDTCSSLQSALDKAIDILLHDTTIAKDEMITSCTQLTSHVQENKASICSQLQQVQKELSTWLSSTQSTMQVMQEQLSKQHTQMSLIQTTLQDHQSMVQKESEAFLGQQHALTKQFQADIVSFKEKLMTYQQSFFSEMDESMLVQQKTLQSKAKNIESTITTLLQDLLTVNSEIFSSQKSKMVQYQQEQQTVVTNATTSLLGLQTKSQQQEDSYHQLMLQKMSEHSKSLVTSMQQMQSGISVPIKTIQDNLVPSVGLKRKGYEENMENVQGNISSLTNHTIEQIGKTSSMAESVLTKVHTASTAMNQSMHNDVDKFVVYMQQEGEQVYSVVKSHFSDLEKANVTHEKDIVTMQQNTTTYVTEYPSYEVKPTGHTPKKCKVLPPVSYTSTRGHEYIKYDCRNALQEITYDVIHDSVCAISKANEQPLPTPPPVVEIEEETISVPSMSLEATLESNFNQKLEKSNSAASVSQASSQEDSNGNTTESEDSENVAPATNSISLSTTTPSTTKGRGKGSRSAGSKIASVGTRSTRSSVVATNLEI
jgi:kinesin family protein 11